MWKKLIALLLSVLIICSLTACSMTAETTHETVTPATEEQEVSNTEENETKNSSGSKHGNKTESAVTGDEETYTLSGTVTESLVIESENDVVIVLDNVTAKLEDSVIKIKSAKSAVLVINGTNTIESTAADTKAVSSDVDLTIEGDGTLNVISADTCIKSDTNLTVNSGILNLNGGSDGDGLRSDETLTINGGTISISSGEGIESTQITINDGTVVISATDDGINASNKSETLTPSVTINGGNLDIVMAQGDTDAVDSNGSLTIAGGNINISAQFAFDYDSTVSFTGGTVYVNGQQVTQITNSMFGGGQGNWGGPQGGMVPGENPPSGGPGQQGPGGMHP